MSPAPHWESAALFWMMAAAMATGSLAARRAGDLPDGESSAVRT
ncbi:MAG: hypothetical protein V9G29_15715 [Burkholderiaceae bacterium]